jgi:hypothetical protein
MLTSILNRLKPDFFQVATLKDLDFVNGQLSAMGLPPFWRGFLNEEKIFNPHYKVSVSPRFVLTWGGLRINQLYLMPFAKKGELMYSVFVNKFYADVATEDLPDVLEGPEITIQF